MNHTSSLPAVAGLVALVGAAGAVADVDRASFIGSLRVLRHGVHRGRSDHQPAPDRVDRAHTRLEHDGNGYVATNALERRLAPIVTRRCADAGLPLVKVGIVDDGMPTAFTFGRSPWSARLWVSSGLFERLDEDELDAVVCHELGHVKHWDGVPDDGRRAWCPCCSTGRGSRCWTATTMTMKATARSSGSSCWSRTPSRSSCLLGLSRSREYNADRWSCECTGNGDTLGVGPRDHRVRDRRRTPTPATSSATHPPHPPLGPRKRVGSSGGEAGSSRPWCSASRTPGRLPLPLAVAPLGDVDRAVDAMRWEVVSPWAPVLEKLSTHPLVARQIQALEESGLPGSPRRWSISRSLASIVPHNRRAVRRAAAADGALAISPWLLLIAAVALGAGMQSRLSTGLALVTAGGLLLAKQPRKYLSDFSPSEVTPLLGRLDASPVAGIPVDYAGALIGRADAGNVLSPDLVLQDCTGFVPLARFSLLPLAGTAFALTQAESLARQRGRGPTGL